MKKPSNRGAKVLLGVGAASLLAAGIVMAVRETADAAPVRWGSHGHRIATRSALLHLPSGVPAFFRNAGEQLEYLSPEPDRWYSGDLREMEEAWRYDHFIDLENLPSGAQDAPDRFRFLEVLFEAGISRPQSTVGFLPFRIMELYQRLASGFARWRLAPDGPDRQWIQARILNDAGILSHYVVDAAQPHHTTIHFNGWAEGAPNPRGFTTDRDFHSRLESGFVNAHIRRGDLTPRMAPDPRSLDDVRSSVWEYLRASNGEVSRLYELEKTFGFDPDSPADPETREFILAQLTEGAEMLRAIWWSAWRESEEMAREERRQRGS